MAEIFTNGTEPQSNDWDSSFDSYVNKMIFKFRERGYMCDKVNSRSIPGGKAVLLSLSNDVMPHQEFYEVFYKGRIIIGKYRGDL